ncbi:uncharacterized protein LOC126900072 [Daktulosphaira vitifoliae]|uniref:uncharacterized protein LOC126900072 n=1 Tax=Daktulosphaira vitifoliae TaxID=58002 RepID=UPI0021AA5496|nr:uncharacterized protein LOC126900072 [Daktulosphaira vitifoliae]
MHEVMQGVYGNKDAVIGGYMNGHVGNERRGYERVHGGYGFSGKNEAGERILDFTVSYDLAVKNKIVLRVFWRDNVVELNLFSSSEYETEDDLSGSSYSSKTRGFITFMNPKLLSALDQCKISDRDAVHLIISTAEALGNNVSKLIINRSTIRRGRLFFSERKVNDIKKIKFLDKNSLVLHWDGKLLPGIINRAKVDRLPILVSFEGVSQLLGFPKIESDSGENQVNAIFDLLQVWDVKNKIQALCCDTTASNTGRLNDACILLKQLLERNVLYLPCRRHILELVLKNVFKVKLNLCTTGPVVSIFKNLKNV